MLQFSILTIGTFVTMLDAVTIFTADQCFKKDIRKAIPLFSLAYGLILGIAGFYIPSVEMGSNIIEAIAIGLSAGAAATGVNQVGKQLKKDDSLSAVIKHLNDFLLTIADPDDCDCVEDSSESDVPDTDDNSDNDDDPVLSDENHYGGGTFCG